MTIAHSMTTYRLYTKKHFSSPWRLAGTYHALGPANDRLSTYVKDGAHVGLKVERHVVTVLTTWGVDA